MCKKIAFIVNPIAGANNYKQQDLISMLNSPLFKEYQVFYQVSQYPQHASEICKQLIKEAYDTIVAVGGDGTVNEVAKELVHTDIQLGIIPLGSGNGLARHLKIPTNVKKAIALILEGKSTLIDYGLANEKMFFCTCGVGFDAHISKVFSYSSKRGAATYIKEVITAYFAYKPHRYDLKNKDFLWKDEAFLITFANASQYGNNVYIAPEANIKDGLMDITILSKFPLQATPKLTFELLTKNIYHNYYATTIQTDHILLKKTSNSCFHLDGEIVNIGNHIKIKIIKSGLKVLVNQQFKD